MVVAFLKTHYSGRRSANKIDYFGNIYQIVDPAALAEKVPFIYHQATITYVL